MSGCIRRIAAEPAAPLHELEPPCRRHEQRDQGLLQVGVLHVVYLYTMPCRDLGVLLVEVQDLCTDLDLLVGEDRDAKPLGGFTSTSPWERLTMRVEALLRMMSGVSFRVR